MIETYKDRAWLYEKYWVKKLTVRKMAKLCKVDPATILNWMERLNVSRRTNSEARTGKHLSRETKTKMSLAHKGKGRGRHKSTNGYILVIVDSKDTFAKMRQGDGYVYEHRLLMAKNLGRCLKKWEMVHHINGKKDDNKLDNLILMNEREHGGFTLQINRLIKRIRELEKENKELKEEETYSGMSVKEIKIGGTD